LDVAFVADRLGGNFAVIGFSMGGYGALTLAGAGVSDAAMAHEEGPAHGLWGLHRAPVAPARLKAIVPIGPWGRQRGVWDAAGLARVKLPCLLIAGSADEISGYDNGMRLIFDELGGPAWLLSFLNAGHNAGAAVPAPVEAWEPSEYLDFSPFQHYGDPVWDTVRMNNIAQHFVRGFLDLHLKGEAASAAYLAPGWKGFAEGRAPGLVLEQRLG